MSTCIYLKYIIYIALLFFVIPIRIKSPLEEQFENYLKKFNKSYNESIYPLRYQAFVKSLNDIDRLNSHPNRTNNTAIYGLTKFSDMFIEELVQINLSTYNINYNKKQMKPLQLRKRDLLVKKIDWRKKGAITKIRNQENCGACWAFSAVETIESMYYIKTGQLIEFSVQQLIDCAGYGNDGCNGGDTCNLLQWMKDKEIKLQKEIDYLYNYHKNNCNLNLTNEMGIVQIDNFNCGNLINNEEILLRLLSEKGPVSVAINAKTWQNYIGGIIQFHCENDLTMLNHAVQIVGYDLTSEIPHYIVRNTWGQDFGDGGYLYIAIGENLCGLAYEVSTLTVK